MQVVSIISTKGGVGKTTTAANLGGRARQSESPSTDAGFVQSRIPLSFSCVTCCIRDKPRRFAPFAR